MTSPTKSSALGFPVPVQASASSAYVNVPGNNPTLSGLPLVVLSRLVHMFPPVARFLWYNAHFGTLKELKALESYPTRYDPCVVTVLTETVSTAISPLFSQPNLFHSSDEYVAAYKSKQTTPTAIAEYLLLVIRSPPHSLAFVDINDEITLAAAKASTDRYVQGRELGPLDGVPIAVKDEVDVKGFKKTFGSAKIFGDGTPDTAWAVKKLEEAGAIIIGKTNMHEFGSDTTNNNPAKGTPKNPYNKGYYTGGSSGGSGYAVGAGIVPIAVAADGGGSIRIPSSYCGVYGIKPSHGRVSCRPSPSLTTSNGVLGPIAGTIDDLVLAYRVMSQPDPSDPSSAGFSSPLPLLAPITNPSPKKIMGIFRPWFDDCAPNIRTLCQSAVQALAEKKGYDLVEIEIPYLNEARIAHALSIICEMHAAVGDDLSIANAPNRVLLSVAAQTHSQDFLAAARMRALIMSHLAYLYRTHRGLIIVTPTTPMAGVPIKSEGDLVYGLSDTNTSLKSMRYVFLANLSGCPAVVSGIGYDTLNGTKNGGNSGLMVSLMGMAEWGQEEALFGFAKEVEEVSFLAADGVKRRTGESWVDVLGAVGIDSRVA